MATLKYCYNKICDKKKIDGQLTFQFDRNKIFKKWD